jgi:hypothetical protein
MRSEKLKTEREIEALLRDRIRIVQDDARRDTRTFRITGYRNAARDIAAMLTPEAEKSREQQDSRLSAS